MANYAATEGGALIRIEMVTTEFTTSHPANGVDEVGPVKILKSVLVRIMGVGTTIEVVGRRIFTTLLITSILRITSAHALGIVLRNLRGNLLR